MFPYSSRKSLDGRSPLQHYVEGYNYCKMILSGHGLSFKSHAYTVIIGTNTIGIVGDAKGHNLCFLMFYSSEKSRQKSASALISKGMQ